MSSKTLVKTFICHLLGNFVGTYSCASCLLFTKEDCDGLVHGLFRHIFPERYRDLLAASFKSSLFASAAEKTEFFFTSGVEFAFDNSLVQIRFLFKVISEVATKD